MSAVALAGTAVSFVTAPPGLIDTDFALFPIENGLYALRAVSDAVRLFVVDATLLPAYAPEITDEQAALLGLDAGASAEVYVVVNPAGDETVVNLLAPVVVNRDTRAAAQLVLEDGDWPLRALLRPLLGG